MVMSARNAGSTATPSHSIGNPATGPSLDYTAIVTQMATITFSDPLLNTLSGATQRIAGLNKSLGSNKEEYTALSDRVVRFVGDIMKRATTHGMDPEFTQAVVSVSTVVEEIATVMAIQSNKNTILRTINRSNTTEELKRLNKKWDEAVTAFHNLLLKNIVSSQQRLQVDLGPDLQEPRTHARYVPSDIPILRLPPRPQIFYGRDDVVERVVNSLMGEETARVAILGPGGIGKTSLATTVLHDTRVSHKFGSNRIFVSCDGITSADGVISVLAAAFKLLDQDDVREALMGYLALLRAAVVLVLDNFESAWDTIDQTSVEGLLTEFSNIPNLSLVVTMRGATRPGGVRWSLPPLPALGPLAPDDAREVFVTICPKNDADADLDTLLGHLDGIPLAITLMAYQGQTLKVAELIRAYDREKTGLLKRGRNRRLTSVDVSIEVSLQSLTMREHPLAAQALSLLSMLPDGIHAAAFQQAIPSMPNCAEATRTLVQVALASNEHTVLRVLAPIREFMLQHYAPDGICLAELQRYFMQMTSRASELVTASGPQIIKDLTPQFGNMQAVLMYTWINWSTVSPELKLEEATLDFAAFSYTTSYGDCTALLRKAIQALSLKDHQISNHATVSSRFGPPNRRSASNDEDKNMDQHLVFRARFMLQLGDVLGNQSAYKDVVDMLTEARAVFDAVNQWRGVAQCLRSLGNTYRMQSRYNEAVDQVTEARAVFIAIGHQLGATQCLQILGNISVLQDQYDEAATQLTEARAGFSALGDKLGAAQCPRSLGEISRVQRRHNEAITQLTAAQAEFEALGNRLGAAQCLCSLGDLSRLQDRYEDGVAQLIDAREAFDAIGSRLGAAQCLRSLGNIRRMQHRYNNAVEQLKEARAVFDGIGSRLGTAQCVRSLGEISLIQDQYGEALEQMSDARRLFQDIGHQLGAAQCLQSLGDLAVMQDRYDDAVDQVSQARELFSKIGYQLGVAQCLLILGDIARKQSRYDDATDQLIRARAEFQDFGDRLGVAQCLLNLADVSRMQRRYDEPIEQLTDASAVFDVIGDPLGAAQCLRSLGEIFGMQDRDDEAVEKLTEAQSVFEALNDRLGAAQCLLNLGDISRTQVRYDDAIDQLTRARAAFDGLGNRVLAAQCIQSLGEVARMQQRYDDAEQLLTEAQTVYEVIEDARAMAHCQELLGYTNISQGNAFAGLKNLWVASALYMRAGLLQDLDRCQKALDELCEEPDMLDSEDWGAMLPNVC